MATKTVNVFDTGDRENVLVRLTVREARHSEQGDDGAVVRQRVHTAAGHGGDAVKDFERDVRSFGGELELVRHRG
jgi:hypothetical protein